MPAENVMEEMPESFAGTSGLVDDVDITVLDTTRWDVDSDYRDGEVTVFIFAYLDEEAGEEHEQFYSCGSGYEAKKGSKNLIAVKEDSGEPPARGFGKQSNYYKLLESAVKAGAGAALAGNGSGESFDASIWHGLRFHMMRETFPALKGLADSKEREILLVSEFHADGKKPAKTATGATKKAAPKKEEAEEEAEEEGAAEPTGLPKVLEVKLKAAAKKAANHDAFIEAAFEIDGVSGNADVEAVIADEEQFDTWHNS